MSSIFPPIGGAAFIPSPEGRGLRRDLVKIAVVQFAIQQFAPRENLRKAEQFIKEAVSQQVQIIVFPEDFVTGPLSGNNAFADYERRYVKHFQQLALQYSIDIVPGSIIEGDSTELYNTTYYIDRTGEIQGRYQKVNLWLPERGYITAGTGIPVFNTRYGKMGLIICWDLMFPEVFRAMVRQDVDIVICPSYWCFEDAGEGIKHDANAEIKLVNALCVTRAFENEVVLVYANAAGSANYEGIEEHLIGRSQITVPFKGSLQLLDHNKEAMFIQEVDTAILQDAEKSYEIRKDLKARVKCYLLNIQWPCLFPCKLWWKWFAAADLKPVEEVGKSHQYKERISHGNRLDKARNILHKEHIGCTCIEIRINDGCQQRDAPPAKQPEAVKSTGIGQ